VRIEGRPVFLNPHPSSLKPAEDPTTAYDAVAGVEHDRLPGRDGACGSSKHTSARHQSFATTIAATAGVR